MESKEFQVLVMKTEVMHGEHLMLASLVMALLDAVDEPVRHAALQAASRDRERGLAISLGSANASEALMRGIENAAKQFRIPD